MPYRQRRASNAIYLIKQNCVGEGIYQRWKKNEKTEIVEDRGSELRERPYETVKPCKIVNGCGSHRSELRMHNERKNSKSV